MKTYYRFAIFCKVPVFKTRLEFLINISHDFFSYIFSFFFRKPKCLPYCRDVNGTVSGALSLVQTGGSPYLKVQLKSADTSNGMCNHYELFKEGTQLTAIMVCATIMSYSRKELS